MDEAN